MKLPAPYPDAPGPEAARRHSISAVERDTGLSKDTLRVWERRYGFPTPTRDQHGERAYDEAQIEKLRTLKRLVDLGHRPGRIVRQSLTALIELARASVVTFGPEEASPVLREYLALINSHRANELYDRFLQTLHRDGLQRFIVDTVVPLNREVGIAWVRGQFEIYEEHLYSEMVQTLLRNAVAALPQPARRPRVLLTTLAGEQHQIGLLIVQALLRLEGATCISLGPQTPVRDIVLAALRHSIDVVGLSFSAAFAHAQVGPALADLRGKLPAEVELWAGGTNPGVLAVRPRTGLRTIARLEDLSANVGDWRRAHGEAG